MQIGVKMVQGIIRTLIVEGIKATRQKSVIAAKEATRTSTHHLDHSTVTRSDVANVAHKVEELRSDVHAAFDDVSETIRMHSEHLARLIEDHNGIIRELIEVISHLH